MNKKLSLLLVVSIIIALMFAFSCQQAVEEPVDTQSDAEALFNDVNTVMHCQTVDLIKTDTKVNITFNGLKSGTMLIAGNATYDSKNSVYYLNLTFTFNNFDYGGKYVVKSGSLTLVQSGTVNAAGDIYTFSSNVCSGTLIITGKYNGSLGIDSTSSGTINTSTKTVTTAGTLKVTVAGNTYNKTYNITFNY